MTGINKTESQQIDLTDNMNSGDAANLYRQIFSYLFVGGIGFLVDAGILMGLIFLTGADPRLIRLFSFLIAVFVTWYLNRTVTFKTSGRISKRPHKQYFKYLFAQIICASVNLSIFYILVSYADGILALPLVALSCAAAGSMVLTFLFAKYWVFKFR